MAKQEEVKVTAKALASELDMTPKKLRRKLRSLAADGNVTHTKADRWEFTREEANAIIDHLTRQPEPEAVEA